MRNEKFNPDEEEIEMISEIVLMRLSVISEDEIEIGTFSKSSNIPSEHVQVVIPYLRKDNLLKKMTNLSLTEKGILKAKELKNRGATLIGEQLKNSSMSINNPKNKGAIFSGNKITNNSDVNVNIENEGEFTDNEIESSKAEVSLGRKKNNFFEFLKWIIPVLISLGILYFGYLNYIK